MKLRFIGSAARSTLSVAALVVGLFGAATASEASDPIGIYGLVDRVVFEPGPDNAERVQVWGVFSVAVKDSRDAYAAPKAGYLYYTVKPGEESKCRKEWADFNSVAGKRQCIGFGSRRGENGKLRDAKEKPAHPDLHPVAFGVVKVRDSEYEPIKKLLSFRSDKKAGEPAK